MQLFLPHSRYFQQKLLASGKRFLLTAIGERIYASASAGLDSIEMKVTKKA